MRNILLTGANGYVGGYVLPELLKKKYEVTCFIKRGTPVPEGWGREFKIVEGDLLDKKSLDDALMGIDAVIHLAAAVRIKSPESNHQINVIGTQNLINACTMRKIKRVVFTSSVSALRRKRGPYGESKYQAEKLFENSHLNYTIFRPTLIYGTKSPGIKNIVNYIQMFPFFIPLIGSGKYTRQPVSVYDVARVLVGCLGKKETFRKTYPLAGADVLTFRELVKMIAEEMGYGKVMVPVPIVVCNLVAKLFEMALPNPPFTTEHIRSLSEDTLMDISQLKRDLNYEPTALEVGIKKLVEELKSRGVVR